MRAALLFVTCLFTGCTISPSPAATPPADCAIVSLVADPTVFHVGENATFSVRVTNCGTATLARSTPCVSANWNPVLETNGTQYWLDNGTATNPFLCLPMVGHWSLGPAESAQVAFIWNGTLESCANADPCSITKATSGDHTLRTSVSEWTANRTIRILS